MSKETYIARKIDDDTGEIDFLGKIYTIKSNGDVFNGSRKLAASDNGHGYKTLHFRVKGVRKRFYIHRVVADIFIINTENKPNVNHIDLDRGNNNKNNLEWCTQKENVTYSANLGSYDDKGGKVTLQFDLEGNFIKEWLTAKRAADFFNCTKELINQAARLTCKTCHTAKGFKWVYKEDYLKMIEDGIL